MDHVAALGVVQALEVDAGQAIDDAQVSRLCEERVVVHESPQRDQAIEAAGVLVVPEDATDPQHDRTVTCTGSCFAGSYRVRKREDDSRMRSICGSRFVDHSAKK